MTSENEEKKLVGNNDSLIQSELVYYLLFDTI